MEMWPRSSPPVWQRPPPSVHSPLHGSLPLASEITSMHSRGMKSSLAHPGYSLQSVPEDCLLKLPPVWKCVPPPIAKCCYIQQELSVSPQLSGSQYASCASRGLDTQCRQVTTQDCSWDISNAKASTSTAAHDMAATYMDLGPSPKVDSSTTRPVVCSPVRSNTSGHLGHDYNFLTSLPPPTLPFPPPLLPIPPPHLPFPPRLLTIPPPRLTIPPPAVPFSQIPSTLSTQITSLSPPMVPMTLTVKPASHHTDPWTQCSTSVLVPLTLDETVDSRAPEVQNLEPPTQCTTLLARYKPPITQYSPPVTQCTAASHCITTTSQCITPITKSLTPDKTLLTNYKLCPTKNNEPMKKDIEYKVHNWATSVFYRMQTTQCMTTENETTTTKYVKPVARCESHIANCETSTARRESRIASREMPTAKRESHLASRKSHIASRESHIASRETSTARRESRIASREMPTAKRESHLSRRECHIASRETSTARRELRIASRDTPTARRESRIASRDTPTAKRESHLARRESHIASRETSTARRESRIASRDPATAKRESHLARRESHIARRESPAARRESPAARRESPAARHESHKFSHKTSTARRESRVASCGTSMARRKSRIASCVTARHVSRVASCVTSMAKHESRIASRETSTSRRESRIASHETTKRESHLARRDSTIARHAVPTTRHITSLIKCVTSMAKHVTPVSRCKSHVTSSLPPLKQFKEALDQPMTHMKKYDEPITHQAAPVTQTIQVVQPTHVSRVNPLSLPTSNDQPMSVNKNKPIILPTSESQPVPVNRVTPLIRQHPSVHKYPSTTHLLPSSPYRTEMSDKALLCTGNILKEVITDMGLSSKSIESLIDESVLEGLAENLPESHKFGDVTADFVKREETECKGTFSVLTREASTKKLNCLSTAPSGIAHIDGSDEKYIKTENLEEVEEYFIKTEEWAEDDDAAGIKTKEYEGNTNILSRVKKGQNKDQIVKPEDDIIKTEKPFCKANVAESADECNSVGQLKSGGVAVSASKEGPVSGTLVDCNGGGGDGFLLDEEFLETSMDTLVPVCLVTSPSTEGCSKTMEKFGDILSSKTSSIIQSHVTHMETPGTQKLDIPDYQTNKDDSNESIVTQVFKKTDQKLKLKTISGSDFRFSGAVDYTLDSDVQTGNISQQETEIENNVNNADGCLNLEEKPNSCELLVRNNLRIRREVKSRKRKRIEGNLEARSASKRHAPASEKSRSCDASSKKSRKEMRKALSTCSYVVQDYVSDKCPLGHHLDPFRATVNVHTYDITALCTSCNITIRMHS